MGYRLNGDDFKHIEKSINTEKKLILIEASKLSEPFFDGIKRYVYELLLAAKSFQSSFQIDVLINGEIISIEEALALEGQEQSIKQNQLFILAKNVLKAILPDTAYNSVARTFPIQKLHSNRTRHRIEKAVAHYDALLLTLPQHFEAVKGITSSKKFAIIHDTTHFSHPDLHEENNARLAAGGMQWIRENNVQCIAVSQSTAYDLSKQGIDSTLIYEGVNRKMFYPIHNQHLLQLVRERYELPNRKFLLSVSTLEPRKNIVRLINAYAELSATLRNEYHLVLVGRKGWKWNSVKIPAHCKDQIHFTGFVRDEHLPALYTSASGFCYVSLYEGFGLPVLEALACGTPVLVSNNSSLPELVGEVGILCDPLNNESIQSGLESLIQKSKVTQIDHQCMRQSWNFSWQKTWKETMNYLT
jgi:glycosyltransferase involved in cell wall biosynthesis